MSQGANGRRIAGGGEIDAGKVLRRCREYASETCDRRSGVYEVEGWICECKQGVSCLNRLKFEESRAPASARIVNLCARGTLKLHRASTLLVH